MPNIHDIIIVVTTIAFLAIVLFARVSITISGRKPAAPPVAEPPAPTEWQCSTFESLCAMLDLAVDHTSAGCSDGSIMAKVEALTAADLRGIVATAVTARDFVSAVHDLIHDDDATEYAAAIMGAWRFAEALALSVEWPDADGAGRCAECAHDDDAEATSVSTNDDAVVDSEPTPVA